MPDTVLLSILLVLGFIVLALAVMAVLGWLIVLAFRRREHKRGPRAEHSQSFTVANGLFELGEIDDRRSRARHDR